ncbi:MAG TPA: TPM domain-containing protein [Burkholderiales bacterium]
MVAGRVLLTAVLCAASAFAFALDVPYLSGRVVDEAEILSPAARTRIAELSRQHESRTGNQIAVLTMPTLEGTSIEEFAVEVFEKWQLGQKGVDNGVLILVAPSERRMRIEVGYGLEGTLTDLAASRIIRYEMTPRFKEGDFDGGVEAGVRAIVALLEGGDAPAAADPPPQRVQALFEGPDLSWPERILMGCFIFGIIGLFTVLGVLTPGFGWFLYVFLIPFWAMLPIVVVGTYGALVLLVIYVVAFPIAKVLVSRTDWFRRANEDLKTKGRANIGGLVLTAGGSSSSRGWSSGSSRSGGFSGGGGRSGGGGASGSW